MQAGPSSITSDLCFPKLPPQIVCVLYIALLGNPYKNLIASCCYQVWVWPLHCRLVLVCRNVLNFSPADDQCGISLAACKVTVIKLLLLAEAYILCLKEVRDCYRAFLFFPMEMFMWWVHLLIASFWLWKLSLHLVFRLDFKWGKKLEKRLFACKRLDYPVGLTFRGSKVCPS